MTKVIVFGSFDPLHEGHRDFFRQAKKLGDYLVVVVARDENIKRIKKKAMPAGRQESRIKEDERLAKVKAEKIVDEATLGDIGENYTVLEKIQPDIIAIGYDQKVPEEIKNRLSEFKIIKLKPFHPEKYKSSKISIL